MVLALGVTGYYFDGPASAHIPNFISRLLLFPLHLIESAGDAPFITLITGNPTAMFLTLWMIYSLITVWMSPLLMIRHHTPEELRKWYSARLNSRG
ncbi:MAG TPA: hypothetical protein VFW78_11245 [Bacteroidia bacterium]|nr:hypothetical protein [Bacteroidia bacterium]